LIEAEFGDVRLSDRVIKVVESLSRNPGASVPEACRTAAATKATYRFWAHQNVTCQAILEPHIKNTVQRAARESTVLAVQDQMLVNLSHHPQTKGLGYLKTKQQRGILLHQMLAVSGNGVPLGLLYQHFWTRSAAEFGKKKQRNRKLTKEKETRNWLQGLDAAQRTLKGHPCVVVVGDRESDLYDLFAAPRWENVHLLVRVRDWQRRVDHPAGSLKKAMQQQPVQAKVHVEIPRADHKPGRQVELSLRWASLEILRPVNHPDRAAPKSLRLWFLLAMEENPPAGEKPICWLLATTQPILTLDDAMRTLRWYTFRWRIEQFHFVQKSGCRIENLQLETAERLQRAITTYSLIAWHLLWLTYVARTAPDVVCVEVMPELNWEVLYHATHGHRALPTRPPTTREATRWIASLGGFLGRNGDKEPGVQTLWRGWRRLQDIIAGYHLARQPPRAAHHELTSSETCG
jgi:hypothetical protein